MTHNLKEICLESRKAGAKLNGNIGLKWWPYRGRAPSDQSHVFFLNAHTSSKILTWNYGAPVLENVLNKTSVGEYCRHPLQNLRDHISKGIFKGNLGHNDSFLDGPHWVDNFPGWLTLLYKHDLSPSFCLEQFGREIINHWCFERYKPINLVTKQTYIASVNQSAIIFCH